MVQIKTLQLTFTGEYEMLNNAVDCDSLLTSIVAESGLTTLQTLSHNFDPQGISIIKLLAESHAALHTWPETKQGYVTLTTCNSSKLKEDILRALFIQHNLEVINISVIHDGTPL